MPIRGPSRGHPLMSPVYRLPSPRANRRLLPRVKARTNQAAGGQADAYGYHRAHWKAIRRARLELAGYRCELRIKCDGAQATHVHLAHELAGNHDAALDDARACCAQCSGAIDGGLANG
jgi:hypothetical protein